tara:strand:- start:443 stop:1081 length:639 start_codon:yes stop_codon:yes gene_type:complete
MSRTLTNGMTAVTTADVVRPAYFVRMVFDSGESPNVLNIWNGVGDLAFGGNTYTGTGDLLSISQITETSDIAATGINVSLTGVKTSFIAIAKDHEYQGRPLTVSLGAFDASGDLIADPVIVFSGFMDTMTISESGANSTISIAVENKLIAFERTKVRRYTAEDQKIDHPTDKGFEFVTAIVQKEIIWGRPTPATGGGGGNSGNQGGANTQKY